MFKINSEFHHSIIKEMNEIKENKENRLKRKFFTISERYKPIKKQKNNLSHPGDVIIDLIYRELNRLYRSKSQKEFHQIFLATCLRLIYQDEYASQRHRVVEKYGFPTKKQQTILLAARRLGKSFAVAFFAAVMIICVDEIEISIFSASKRQSQMLMNHVQKFLQKLGYESRIKQKNEERMTVRTFNGKESKLNAFPAIVSSLKGVSASIIILEEAAIIPHEVLSEVCLPLFQLENVSLIAISTITDNFNFLTRYLKMKDPNNEPLFYSKQIILACQRCIDEEKPGSCTHMSHLLPQWSSGRKRKIINSIMREDEDMLAREIGGLANNINKPAFDLKLVTKLFEESRFEINENFDYPRLFISVDPSACGTKSEFALTTILQFENKHIIVGMESFRGKNAMENYEIILQHCRYLDNIPVFAETLRVFILESNLGLESEHIRHYLRENKVERYIILNETEKRTGFLTTNAVKQLAVEKTRELIKNGDLKFADDKYFVSVSHSYKMIFTMLLEQFHAFAEVIKQTGSKVRKFYSGKIQHQKDDLLITLLLNICWSNHFYKLLNNNHDKI